MGGVPNNDQDFLPDVPTDPKDWLRLRTFMTGVKKAVQGYIQNPDAPDMVENLRVATDTGGVILVWDTSNRATGYIIYRAFDSNRFKNAKAIAFINRADALAYFDPNGQNANATTRYYWVVATNGPVTSPISLSVSSPEVAAATGGVNAELLKNQVREMEIAALSAFDVAAAPSATDTSTYFVTIGTTKNWPTGTRVTVSATANGLVTLTQYYLTRLSSTTFAFHTNIDDARNDASRVHLTGTISATITPNALVFCSFPGTASPAAQATFRNHGTGGYWVVGFGGTAPTLTAYSVKVMPGDATLGNLGEAYTEINPPVGDVCVLHSDSTVTGAGVLASYAGWNDNTTPLAGPTGTAGSVWYNGTGAPSGGLGVNGDYYLNNSNSDVYYKTGGSWVIIENIKGATGSNGTNGTNGAVWFEGTGAPSGGTGSTNDFYLDVTAASAGIPAMVKIGESLLGVDASSVSFTSIPQTYRHLKLVFMGRVTAAVAIANVLLQFNGDTGANYDWDFFIVQNATTTNTAASYASTSIAAGIAPGTSSTRTTQVGLIEITIPMYAGTTFEKTAIATGGSSDGTATTHINVNTVSCFWRSTAAINRIDFLLGSGNYKAGSLFTLYGIN